MDPRLPQLIKAEVQILVEGRDIEGVCEAMIKHLQLQNIEIRDFGGVNELRRYLTAFRARAGFPLAKRIGIVRDAELNEKDAFRSVQGALEHA